MQADAISSPLKTQIPTFRQAQQTGGSTFSRGRGGKEISLEIALAAVGHPSAAARLRSAGEGAALLDSGFPFGS